MHRDRYADNPKSGRGDRFDPIRRNPYLYGADGNKPRHRSRDDSAGHRREGAAMNLLHFILTNNRARAAAILREKAIEKARLTEARNPTKKPERRKAMK